MLGLRHGTVELVAYRPEWAEAFREERIRLGRALSRLRCRVEHVGSTAVPGLLAKPILDIAVGIAAGQAVEGVIAALRGLSYEYRGDAGAEGGHVLVRGPEPLVRTHHVHVVDLGGAQWTSYLRFRDLLRRDPDARERYSTAKAALARRSPADREAYTASKDAIVHRLLAEASGCR